MRWSWKSMWSWFTRKRPAEPTATTMARGERGAWRRLPVLGTTVPTTPWTVAASQTAVAATSYPLIHRTPAPRRGEVPRGRVDGLVTTAPAAVTSAVLSVPDEIADAGGVPGTVAAGGGRPLRGKTARVRTPMVSTGSLNTAVSAAADGTTADPVAPALTPEESTATATASEGHLPDVPEHRVTATGAAPAGGLAPRPLTQATDEFVGEPRPVTPPPTRSEFDVMLDAFRPAWMVRTDADTPTYVQARMNQGNGPAGRSDRPAPPDTTEPTAAPEPQVRSGSRASLAESRKRNLAAGHTPRPSAAVARTADDSDTDSPATRPDGTPPAWEAAWSLRHARGARQQGRREESAVEDTTSSSSLPVPRHSTPRRGGGGRVSAATESEEDTSGEPASAVTAADNTAPAAVDDVVAPSLDTTGPSPALPLAPVDMRSDVPSSGSATRGVSTSAPPTGTNPSPAGPDSPVSPIARTNSPAHGEEARPDTAPPTDAAEAESRPHERPQHTGHTAPADRTNRPTTPRPNTSDDSATDRPAVAESPAAAMPSRNATTDGTGTPAAPRPLPSPAKVSPHELTQMDSGPATLLAPNTLPAHDGASAVTAYPPLIHRRGPVPLPPGGAAALATPRTPWDPAVPVVPPPSPDPDNSRPPSGPWPPALHLVHSAPQAPQAPQDVGNTERRRHAAPRHLRAVLRHTVPDGEREPAAEQHTAVPAYAPAHVVWQEAVGGTSVLGDAPGLTGPDTHRAVDGERLPLTHLRRRTHRTSVQQPTAVSAFEAPAQGASPDVPPIPSSAVDTGTSPGTPSGSPSLGPLPADGRGGRAPDTGGAPPSPVSSQESGEWHRVRETLAVLSRRRLVDLDNPAHLDALADRLYERVITHVRRELVVERERHGLLTPSL